MVGAKASGPLRKKRVDNIGALLETMSDISNTSSGEESDEDASSDDDANSEEERELTYRPMVTNESYDDSNPTIQQERSDGDEYKTSLIEACITTNSVDLESLMTVLNGPTECVYKYTRAKLSLTERRRKLDRFLRKVNKTYLITPTEELVQQMKKFIEARAVWFTNTIRKRNYNENHMTDYGCSTGTHPMYGKRRTATHNLRTLFTEHKQAQRAVLEEDTSTNIKNSFCVFCKALYADIGLHLIHCHFKQETSPNGVQYQCELSDKCTFVSGTKFILTEHVLRVHCITRDITKLLQASAYVKAKCGTSAASIKILTERHHYKKTKYVSQDPRVKWPGDHPQEPDLPFWKCSVLDGRHESKRKGRKFKKQKRSTSET